MDELTRGLATEQPGTRGTGRPKLGKRAAAARPAGWRVVVNDDEQYSVWPEYRPVPPGWRSVGPVGAKSACLERIAEVWTDMQPLSLRIAEARPLTAGPGRGTGPDPELGALILSQAAR